MFTKLDRYIVKKFLGTFFFILTLLMSIAAIFDVSEKIDDFIKSGAPLKAILFDYYVNFIIHYGNLFSPLLIFISVIWFTGKMAHQTEIVAILSGGVSFRRFLWPYFLSATFLAGLSLYLNHYQLPIANKERLQFEEDYVRNKFHINDKNLHREIEPGTIVYFESFSYQQSFGYQFSIERWDEGRLVYKLLADKATCDSTNHWLIENYFIRTYDSENKERIRTGRRMDTIIPFNPSDLGQRNTVASALTTPELNKFIEREKLKGSDQVPFYLLEKHQRTSLPFATYILTLIGVSIASRKVRGGIGLHIALGFTIAIIYIFFMKISAVAATNSGLEPMIAVWIPNIIFLGLGAYIYQKTPK